MSGNEIRGFQDYGGAGFDEETVGTLTVGSGVGPGVGPGSGVGVSLDPEQAMTRIIVKTNVQIEITDV